MLDSIVPDRGGGRAAFGGPRPIKHHQKQLKTNKNN